MVAVGPVRAVRIDFQHARRESAARIQALVASGRRSVACCAVPQMILSARYAKTYASDRGRPISQRALPRRRQLVGRRNCTRCPGKGVDDVIARRVRCQHLRHERELAEMIHEEVRQVCDGLLGRSRSYRDTVRSETTIPSLSSSP